MSLSENFDVATTMFRVAPGESPNLDTRDPAWAGDEDRSEKKRKNSPTTFLKLSTSESETATSIDKPLGSLEGSSCNFTMRVSSSSLTKTLYELFVFP